MHGYCRELPAGESGVAAFEVGGTWVTGTLPELEAQLEGIAPLAKTTVLEGAHLERLDAAGAYLLLCKFVRRDSEGRFDLGGLRLQNFRPEHRQIIALVSERVRRPFEMLARVHRGIVATVGRAVFDIAAEIEAMVRFIGETLLSIVGVLLRPWQFRLGEFVVQLEGVMVRAVPLVALMSFLIGVVVAYLFAAQSVKFGAGVYIVDAVSIAMCRELSPMLVAVIMAGRSGSAFTAQIGAMKINEEIDAIKALGLVVQHVIVLPRLFALIIAMPILVFVGNLAGIAGGAIIAHTQVGMTLGTFLDRMQMVLLLKHVYAGLGKAPVFAAVIALTGCRLGLGVENNARSLGISTTATVVQSIVYVILLDAAFAVVFQELGI